MQVNLQETQDFKSLRAQLISSSSNGCHIARQINWLTRWSAVYTIRINKSRRRHLPSSSCPRTPHRTHLKEARVVTPHLDHRVARSTWGAPCRLRQVAVSSCLTAVVNLPDYMATAHTVKTVRHWLLHSKTAKVSYLLNHASKCKVQTMLQTLLRIKLTTKQCRSIRTSQRRIAQLCNQWWQVTPKIVGTILSLDNKINRTCSTPDRKRAVPNLPALLVYKMRNRSNLSEIQSWVKPMQ